MTDLYKALNEEMLAESTITDIVGIGLDAGIYPGIPPPDATAPFISFRRISYQRIESLNGPTTLARATMQIDCWGSNNETMASLSEAVRALFDGFRGDMGTAPPLIPVRRMILDGQNDDPEEPPDGGPLDINRNRMDFDIWHIE